MVYQITFSFEKYRSDGGKEIKISVVVPNDKSTWTVSKLATNIIVENIALLSPLWKRNLKTDGRELLEKRLFFSEHIEETSSALYKSCRIEFIDNATKMSDIPKSSEIHVGLHQKSYLYSDRTLHPIPRIKKNIRQKN